MSLVAALLVAAAVFVLAHGLRIPSMARGVIGCTRQALHELRDPALDARQKEQAMQGHARRLVLLALGMTFASLAAVALPLAALAGLGAVGLVDPGAVLQATISPAFLVLAALLGLGMALFLRRRRP